MSDCPEVLFIGDSSGGLQCVDPRIGTVFISYRGLSAGKPNTLALIGQDYILAADGGKPIVQVWPLNSQEPVSGPKMVLSGKATAVTVSSDGVHCIIGIDAKLYVYQVSSGQQLGVLSKHYRDITKLVFMDDSCHFVSCGENGAVFVWNLATALSRQGLSLIDSGASKEPIYSFSHHSLQVTDAYVGPGAMKARLFTTSIDQTCKMYNLRDGSLLLSIVFESSLTALRPNSIESELYVGTSKGELVQFRLDPLPRSLEYSVQSRDWSKKFQNHSKAVYCIEVSIDGYLLVSAGQDNKVVVWDIPSRQLLKVFPLKGAGTCLILSLASENIFTTNFSPKVLLSNLQRNYNEDVPLEVNILMNEDIDIMDYGERPAPVQNIVSHGQDNTEEVEKLRRQLAEAVAKNKELYRFAMDKLTGNPYAFGDR